MLDLKARSRNQETTSFLWEENLKYPVYYELIGFYYVTVILSHGASTELRERFGYAVDPSVGRALYKIREGGA